MSYESWKQEFLTGTDLEKWIGLRPENLEKHGLKFKGKVVIENGKSVFRKVVIENGKSVFRVDGSTCQLCRDNFRRCYNCPLYQSLGEKYCDDDDDSPYVIFIKTGNPEPMIGALEKIKDKLPKRTEEANP